MSAAFTLQKDPRVYARGVAKKTPERCRVLGPDLGTNCGAAFCDIIPGQPQEGIRSYLELWDLSTGPYDTAMMRLLRLRQFLAVVDPDVVLFEDVRATPPQVPGRQPPIQAIVARVAQTQEFFGVLKGAVAYWCHENDVPCQGAGILEIKAFAMKQAEMVKKGTANKEDIIRACNKVFGTDFDPETYEKTGADNLCDAAFVMLLGVTAYSEGLSVPFVLQTKDPPEKPRREKKYGKKAKKKTADE